MTGTSATILALLFTRRDVGVTDTDGRATGTLTPFRRPASVPKVIVG